MLSIFLWVAPRQYRGRIHLVPSACESKQEWEEEREVDGERESKNRAGGRGKKSRHYLGKAWCRSSSNNTVYLDCFV